MNPSKIGLWELIINIIHYFLSVFLEKTSNKEYKQQIIDRFIDNENSCLLQPKLVPCCAGIFVSCKNAQVCIFGYN